MNTTENNKIIAEFMNPNNEYDNFYFPQFREPYIYQGSLNGYSAVFGIEQLKFHSDWNWLIEVVEKIESIGFDVFINTSVCRITDVGEDRFEDIEYFNSNSKIKAVYEAVVEFIKWYNEQK